MATNVPQTRYFCHNCDRNLDTVNESSDGTLICPICHEEYVEIVENDERKTNEQSNINNNNNNTNPNNNNNINWNQNQQNNFNNINNGAFWMNNFIQNVMNAFGQPIPHGNVVRMPLVIHNGNFSFGDYGFGDIQNIIQQLMERDLNNYGPPPASKQSIENLKEIVFGENDQTIDNEEKVINDCAICKDSFVKNEKLILLPCNHKFHKDCIMPWLQRHNTCPVCRYQFPTDDAIYEQIQRMRSQNQNSNTNSNQQSSSQNQNQNNNNNNNNQNV